MSAAVSWLRRGLLTAAAGQVLLRLLRGLRKSRRFAGLKGNPPLSTLSHAQVVYTYCASLPAALVAVARLCTFYQLSDASIACCRHR